MNKKFVYQDGNNKKVMVIKIRVYKTQGISWRPEELLASREWLNSMEIVR